MRGERFFAPARLLGYASCVAAARPVLDPPYPRQGGHGRVIEFRA